MLAPASQSGLLAFRDKRQAVTGLAKQLGTSTTEVMIAVLSAGLKAARKLRAGRRLRRPFAE